MRVYRPLVALDIDGVLADFSTGFTAVAASQGQVPEAFGHDKCPQYRYAFHVDPVWEEIARSHVFWERLDPLIDEDDLSAIHAMAQECNIIYVTCRKETGGVAAQTGRWLQDCELPEGPLFLVGDKLPLLLSAKQDIVAVLDDSPDILTKLADSGLPAVARTWPYNQHVTSVPHVPTVAALVDRLGIRATVAVGYKMPGWDLAGEEWNEDDAGN